MYKIVYKESEGRLKSRFLNAGLRSSPSRIQENSPESFSKATFVSTPRDDAGGSRGMGCTGRRVSPAGALAASRTRLSPANAFPQLCIWDAASCPVFSLVGRLPSIPFAGERLPPLFGHFAGSTRPSDSLRPFMPRLWLVTFPGRPVHSFVSGTDRVSRFSRVEVPHVRGL